MSIKRKQEEFLEMIGKVYPNNKIKITEWNGFTGPIKYLCDICGKEHFYKDARNLIGNLTYCKDNNQRGNKRWEKEEYQERLNKIFDENVEIVEYSGLSNKIFYKCPICERLKSTATARALLSRVSLCDECYGTEKNIIKKKIDEIFEKYKDKYQLLVWRGVKKMTVKCLSCGTIFDRYPANVLHCPDNCPNCNSGKIKQMLSPEEYQKRIDETFSEGQYKIISYTGQLKKNNKAKCLNCGLIFNFQASYFLTGTRGCPKCKRYHSKGEQAVQHYLEENNIKFETQKRFPDCNNNLSSFDFCCYDSEGKMYLVEINGIQHYEQTGRFGDLENIQERDKKKNQYCKDKNIPLIVISYNRTLPLKEIDKNLSFLKGSTTIPTGSKGEASLK